MSRAHLAAIRDFGFEILGLHWRFDSPAKKAQTHKAVSAPPAEKPLWPAIPNTWGLHFALDMSLELS